MKNLLLASTALIGFAGAAAAEVVIEGSAEMGITGGDDVETQFHNGYNLNFVMSGETDTGLSFGATYRLDADASSEENQDPKGDNGTVFVSGAYGKLTLGDTDGALDWAMTETAMGTSLADEHTTHIGYSGNSDNFYDDQVLRYEYAFGDFGVALSVEQDDRDTDNDRLIDDEDVDGGDPFIGLGGKYKTEYSGVTLGFGLGYQTGEGYLSRDLYVKATETVASVDLFGEIDRVGVSASASMDNGFSVVLNYSTLDMEVADSDLDIGLDHYGIGLGYEMGALLLHANYGKYEYDLPDDASDFIEDEYDSFALVANYDLGGGAILAAGYASDVSVDDGDQDQFSVGMSLSF